MNNDKRLEQIRAILNKKIIKCSICGFEYLPMSRQHDDCPGCGRVVDRLLKDMNVTSESLNELDELDDELLGYYESSDSRLHSAKRRLKIRG
jgi:hypothetical protein